MTIEELHAEMQAGFAKIENRFETLETSIRAEMRREMKRHQNALSTHFDVMVEKMQDSVRLVAEATAHHAVRLDDHDKRITRLEDPRRT